MQHLLRRARIRLVASLFQSAAYARANMVYFAILEIIGQPIYYYLWKDVYPQPYESALLRLICVLIALPMLFEKRVPRTRNFEHYIACYWLFNLLFELPFFFFYMTLMNGLSAVWALSSLAAVMILVILVFDWLMTLILTAFGALLAWSVFCFLNGGLLVDPNIPLPALIATYLFGILVGSAVNYKSELVAREKLEAITDAVGTIAHELRTPLLGIRSGARGLGAYLPAIMEGYETARHNGLPVTPIRGAHFKQMRSVLERIDTETEYTSAVLDMLLINSNRASIDRKVFETISAADCIAEALTRYPFHSERERKWIDWSSNTDFKLFGSKLLLVHVLFNLLKNSLYHIAQNGEGEIKIWSIHRASRGNELHFLDTGPGIAAEVLPRVFERFYSGMPRGQGTGIGLAFVQLVIDSFGGHVRCESILGKYTEFIMTFPEMEANVEH